MDLSLSATPPAPVTVNKKGRKMRSLRIIAIMPTTARGSRGHQNECTADERLFIPAFTTHNLRSRTGDDVLEFDVENGFSA